MDTTLRCFMKKMSPALIVSLAVLLLFPFPGIATMPQPPDNSSQNSPISKLNAEMNELEKFITDFDHEVNAFRSEYRELILEVDFRVANAKQALVHASGSSEGLHYCQGDNLDWTVDMSANLIRLLENRLQQLKKLYPELIDMSGKAEGISRTICDYTTFVAPAMTSDRKKLQQMTNEAKRLLNGLDAVDHEYNEIVRAMGESRLPLENKVERLKGLQVQLKNCSNVAERLSGCRKDIQRVEQIRNEIGKSVSAINQSEKWLAGMLRDFRKKVKETELLGVAGPAEQKKKEHLLSRLSMTAETFNNIDLSFTVPAVPSIDCDAYREYGLEDSRKKYDEIESIINQANGVLAEVDGAFLLVSEAFDDQSFTEHVKSARVCYGILKKAVIPDVGDLEKAAREASSLLGELHRAQLQIAVGEGLCDKAGKLKQTMMVQIDTVENAEKKVAEILRAASDLAAQCPDINDPDNIVKLYKKAEELTVQMGAEVVRIIADKNTLADQISQSAKARSQAIEFAKERINKIEALYEIAAQIANRLSPMGQSYWKEVIKYVAEARTVFDQIQQSPECDVTSADDLSTKADNAYAGALANLGANEGLIDKAGECTADADEEERVHAEALAAIADCDLAGAKSLIDSMPEGDKKKSAQKAYDKAAKLEAELKVMVNQEAKAKYQSCDYEEAVEILQKAHTLATCDTHKTKINKSIAAAKKGKQLEAELKVMVNQEAKAKYKACDYDGALEILNKALSRAKCDTHKKKINKSIAAAKKGQQRETELKVLVNEKAKNRFKNCDFNGAVQLLNSALTKAKCQTHKDKIKKSLAAARKRQDKENRISAGVQEALNRNNSGYSIEARNTLNALLKETRCDTQRTKINNAIATITSAERNNRNRQGGCSHCKQFENWLFENRRACGYHGARLPSICSADPECVSWNNRCNEVRRKHQECLHRCQGGATYNPYGN